MKWLLSSLTLLSLALVSPSSLSGQTQDSTELIKDFVAGKIKSFSTKGHAKSKGASFNITYPESWKATEGRRPSIIQSLTNPESSANVMLAVYPTSFTQQLSRAEMKAYFENPETIKEWILPNSTVLSSVATQVEGEPACLIEYTVKQEGAGIKAEFHYFMLGFLRGTNIALVVCSVGEPEGKTEKLERRFRELKPLFQLMMVSIIFED